MVREYNRDQEDKTMLKQRTQYDDEFKKNAVKLSYASPKPVRAVADDLGIAVNLLYNWRNE